MVVCGGAGKRAVARAVREQVAREVGGSAQGGSSADKPAVIVPSLSVSSDESDLALPAFLGTGVQGHAHRPDTGSRSPTPKAGRVYAGFGKGLVPTEPAPSIFGTDELPRAMLKGGSPLASPQRAGGLCGGGALRRALNILDEPSCHVARVEDDAETNKVMNAIARARADVAEGAAATTSAPPQRHRHHHHHRHSHHAHRSRRASATLDTDEDQYQDGERYASREAAGRVVTGRPMVERTHRERSAPACRPPRGSALQSTAASQGGVARRSVRDGMAPAPRFTSPAQPRSGAPRHASCPARRPPGHGSGMGSGGMRLHEALRGAEPKFDRAGYSGRAARESRVGLRV